MNPLSLIGSLFHSVFFTPIVNLLVVIIDGLSWVHIPGALGLSIIILTVLIRLLLWPLMSSQLKLAKKTAELKPHLDALKEKHKDDRQALMSAQSALYKEHGINPAAGCLPTLLQLPILISLYQAIQLLVFNSSGMEKINELLYLPILRLNSKPDPYFLGLNLAFRPADFLTKGWFLLLIPILTALLTYVQSTMMTPKLVKEYPSDSPKEIKEKEQSEDTMAAVQNQMKFMMPLMIGYFAYTLPTGMAIYWNTLTLVGIWQQYLISGWGEVGRWFGKS